MSHKGIILIDMQSGCANPTKVGLQELAHQITGVREILEYGQRERIYSLSVETRDFGEVIPELYLPLEQMRIPRFYKQGESAFLSEGVYTNPSSMVFYETTVLQEVLQSEDISALVIMGVNAPSCVNASIRDAVILGFDVITSAELVLDTMPTIREYGRSRPFLREHTRLLNDHKRVIEYLAKG